MSTLETLPVIKPPGDLRVHQATRVRLVQDPELGRVVVRWRYLIGPDTSPRWRCAGCGIRSQLADACPHIFAAALSLATELLGLISVGVPAGDQHEPNREEPT